MCSGMYNQEYPIQTRGIFPSTPPGTARAILGDVLVSTLKKAWNSTETKGRWRGFKKCLRSLMN